MTIIKKPAPKGRPPLPPAERKRRNFTFRGTDELHEGLTKASAMSGRSLSEEIEWRLGQSFFLQSVINEAVEKTVRATLDHVELQRANEEAQRSGSEGFKTGNDT
jgi:hypothetical protein